MLDDSASGRSGSSDHGATSDRPQWLGETRFLWAWILAGLVVTQVGWLAANFVTPSPLHAAAAVAGGVVMIAILARPHVGVCLLAFLSIGQWPWNLNRYLLIVTLASALGWLLIRQKRLFYSNSVFWLNGLFLVSILLSMLRPRTNIDILSHAVGYGGNCAVTWLLVALVDSRQMIRTVVKLMVLSGVITAAIGLIQWRTHFVWIASTTGGVMTGNDAIYAGKTGFELQQWQGEFRVDSITGTPDYLPLYMQTLLPFAGFWIFRQSSWSRRLLGLSAMALFLIAHFLSFTRGAIVTTAIVFCLFGWVTSRKRLFFYSPIIAVILLGGMLSWGPSRERLLSMFTFLSATSADTDYSGAWRLQVIPVGIEMILEHPWFGVGIGQGRWNWPEHVIGVLIPDPTKTEPLPFHNDYLGVGVELGVGGLLLLLLMLGVIIHRGRSLADYFRIRGDIELSDISRACMIAGVGMAAAMTLYPLVACFRYFWVILGLMGALMRYEQENRTVASVPILDHNERARR